jgi:type I restriction enzyme S subunit
MSEIVPEGWKISQLGNLATVNWGNTTLTKASYVEEGFPAFSAAGNDGLVTNAEHHSTGIVLSAIGARCGRTFLTPEKWTAIKNTIAILTDDQDIRYLYHVFNFDDVWNKSGGAQPFISLGDARKTPILHPPLPEQKKIASILTSVDEVIETTQKQIDKLQDLKKATMNELLTKGIGHTEFKDSELGRIPKSWDVVELRENLTFISYGFTNPMPESTSGNLMVTARDVNNGVIDYENARKTTSEAFEELLTDKSRPKIGDVLLTKDGTLGRLAVVDKEGICINQSVAVLRPNEKISSMFLFNMLSSPYYQKTMLDNAGGSTIKHIYITVVDKMKVVKPPLDEQDAITTVLSKINVQCDIVCRKLSQTQSLKKSLMQDLLTGKVRVKVN